MTTRPDAGYIKERVGAHWGRRAAEFDNQASHGLLTDEQREAWLGVLARLTGPRPLRVLDVGCGTGFLSLLLAGLGHRVTGIDLAAEMLERAREKARAACLSVDFRTGDAEAPDFPYGSFDLIVERHLIWTLPHPERAVAEWLRILKPGGRLALVEGQFNCGPRVMQPEYQEIHDQLPLYRGRSGAELGEFLASCGVPASEVHPLMDAALWGAPPDRERYLIVGHKRAAG